MSLKKYRTKRNFSKTPEPAGKKAQKKGRLYVIQKHAASHLHYDFRLENRGVLLSWAVPKGPSLDPRVKRLAVHVEDHPVSYGSFEGTIPAGQYGAGSVMIWDTGTWEPTESVETGLKKGKLVFRLYGKKLKGLWALIRFKGENKNWLLFKLPDKSVRNSIDYPITHPDRVIYPEKNITKLDLAKYYESVQKWILPYVMNRPLSIVRCPQGREKKCFFQKHFQEKIKGIYPVKIKEKKSAVYFYIKDLQGLLALVQHGALEIHPWNTKIDKIEKPDLIIFDLDPGPGVPWKKVIEAAQILRKQLKALKLESFVKTTGGKGLHVVLPIHRSVSWKEGKLFAEKMVLLMVKQNPKAYINTMSKAKRVGKVFIDYFRNNRGSTSIAPYSTRARENAPVSTPLHWDELTPKLKSDFYTLQNLLTRLKKLKSDPWKGFFKKPQKISKTILKTLEDL